MSVQQTTLTKPRSKPKPDVKVRSAKRHLCQILNVFITAADSTSESRLLAQADDVFTTGGSMLISQRHLRMMSALSRFFHKVKIFPVLCLNRYFRFGFWRTFESHSRLRKINTVLPLQCACAGLFPEWLFTAIYTKILKILGKKNFYDEISKTGNFR